MLYCTLTDLLRGQLSHRLPLLQCDQIILLINSHYHNNLMFILYICKIPYTISALLGKLQPPSLSLRSYSVSPSSHHIQIFSNIFHSYSFITLTKYLSKSVHNVFAKFPLTKRLCLKFRL